MSDAVNIEETLNTQVDPCLVCLSPMGSETWSCSQCHAQCHLSCVLQWTIRSIVSAQTPSHVFTCPNCRHVHHIDSLPGFHANVHPTTPSTSTVRIGPIANPTTVDLFARAFGLVTPPSFSVPPQPNISVRLQTSEPRARRQVTQTETQTQTQENDDDDEEEEEGECVAPSTGLNFYATNIKFTINTLHIHTS